MKKFLNIFIGIQSPLTFFLTLCVKGRYIGSDPYGNKYYTGKARRGYTHERRWVVYAKSDVEASQVPPEYHGWLHHQTDQFPDVDKSSFRQIWQRPHTQNLTGTRLAYRPPGHPSQGGNRPRVCGDYEAWKPE